MADDRHPHASRVFVFREDASEQRLCAQDGPQIAGDFAARQFFGLAVARERRLPRLGGRDIRENRVVAPPLVPLGGRRKELPGTRLAQSSSQIMTRRSASA